MNRIDYEAGQGFRVPGCDPQQHIVCLIISSMRRFLDRQVQQGNPEFTLSDSLSFF